MWVISKKKCLFTKDRLVENDKTGEHSQVIDETFVLEPNVEDLTRPVQAPDWIKSTDFYKLLRKEGSIQESADGPVEKDEDEPKPKHNEQPKTGLPYPAKK